MGFVGRCWNPHVMWNRCRWFVGRFYFVFEQDAQKFVRSGFDYLCARCTTTTTTTTPSKQQQQQQQRQQQQQQPQQQQQRPIHSSSCTNSFRCCLLTLLLVFARTTDHAFVVDEYTREPPNKAAATATMHARVIVVVAVASSVILCSQQQVVDAQTTGTATTTNSNTGAATCGGDCLFRSCDYWTGVQPDYTCEMLEANYSCNCAGCSCFSSHDKCTNNCFGKDCDDLVALGYSCDDLEATYTCDCRGCDCQAASTITPCSASTDCGTGEYCASINTPNNSQPVTGCVACTIDVSDTCTALGVSVDGCSTCTGCAVENASWVGDGFCDAEGGYNTAACSWDGGDCCESTCTLGDVNRTYQCGVHVGYTCEDPNATDYTCTAGAGSCQGYDCDHFTAQGWTCEELEDQFACDCSNCRGCTCEPTCMGYTCDYWSQNRIGYTCETMENDFRCDCTGLVGWLACMAGWSGTMHTYIMYDAHLFACWLVG